MNKIKNNLGETTNILYGYNAEWLSSKQGNNALFPPAKKALAVTKAEPPKEKGEWSFPEITLHETAESLLDTLLPYKLEDPSDGINGPKAPGGPLLIDDVNRSEAIKKLSETLGVDLGKSGHGFALVRLTRTDGNAAHESQEMDILIHPNPSKIPDELGVSKQFKKAMSTLTRFKPRADFSPSEITPEIANDYLGIFAEQGTHYVSSMELGDVIFQIFAMPEARFKRVQKIYASQPEKLKGQDAVLFRQYTTDANTGAFGYVSQYGKVLDFSLSETLAKAVEKGEWKEPTFAETTSIFAVYDGSSKVNPAVLNQNYTSVTSILTRLTSLTLFCEHNRKQIWRRVLQGGLVQKYKAAINPNFFPYCPYDLAAQLNQSELPGFLSTIATPYVNTYKPALDLSTLEFVAAEEVKDFTLYTNYLYTNDSKDIPIPGEKVLLTGQVVDLEQNQTVTRLKLRDKAFDGLIFAAQQFYGALQFENESGSKHFTIVDGLKFVSNDKGPDGRAYVQVDGDFRGAPPKETLKKLTSSMEYSYTYAEGNLNAFARGKLTLLAEFLYESMQWITQIIPADTEDFQLLNLRVRALDMAYIENNTALGAFVPILPYTDYEKQIKGILDYISVIDTTIDRYHQDIEFRKTQELIINVGKDLNKNIIESGKLLAGYVDASIAQQQAMSGYYASIIEQKQAEQKKQEKTVDELRAQLNLSQAEVNTKVENFKQAVKDWKTMEAIKFGLQVATELFSLGTSFLIPSSSISAVKDLGALAQGIQKFLNVSNATWKLFEDTKAGIIKFQDAQKTFDGIANTLSVDIAWDEMSINMDLILSTAPSDPTVNARKAELNAAFKTHVLKGKGYASAMSGVQQTARDIYSNQQQKNMLDDQVKRMKELNKNLNPAKIGDLDKNKIDLIGLTGSLSVVRSQMLGLLSKTFILQDQSLQYTFLQPATPIDSFDVLGILGALVKQQSNTINAKTALKQYQKATTTPIDIKVQIPVEQLRNGGIYQFYLQPDVPDFFLYVDARVKSMVAKIDGVTSTKSGDYLLNVAYVGRPFYDRSYNRDILTFNTLQRQRTYEYEVKGNKPKFSDHGQSWSDGVSPITPFSVWEISLPDTSKNKEISYDGLIATVTLTFVLEARIHDTARAMLKQSSARGAASAKPSVSTLISQMAGKSVLNNWDVVFNMALDKINDVLKQQYEELKNNDKKYGGKISAETSIEGANIGKNIKTYLLQKFDLDYGYPRLEFLVNDNNTGNLEMQIPSGEARKGSRYVGTNTAATKAILVSIAEENGLPASDVKEEKIDGEIKLVLQYYEAPSPIGKAATLQAVVKIGQIKGLVENNDNILSVVLDMQKGAFAAKDIEIEMSDEQKIAFSDAVKAYFVNHPVLFIINSLDLTGIATLMDLKPYQFLFKALKTQSGNEMLQLFIQTNNRAAFNYSQTFISSDVPDPIPEGSQSSLMINSRIFFGSVLPQSLTSGWTFKGNNPGNTTSAWNGEFSNASVQGDVNLSSLNTSRGNRGGSVSYTEYSPYGGNPVTWSINGMTLDSGKDGKLTMNYNKQNVFYFNQSSKTCTIIGCTTPSVSKLSTDITLSIVASLPTEVGGSGREQTLKINLSDKSVAVAARTSGGGPCGSDDLQSQVNKQLQGSLPGQVTSKINVSFKDVSVFALKNLLFPSKNYLNLQSVYVPGDLLILGNFTTGS
ncbi:MAG TPA: hypothetical protein VNB22_11255 [Pyrinomonadaceae bacterium]|nr:hypothetical protein [Pyrinomonadaceae bacterium]